MGRIDRVQTETDRRQRVTDYWQVIRRTPSGGHQSISDHFTAESASELAQIKNSDYQTDEYAVIHRTTEKLLESVNKWWDGSLWLDDWK
jgi:hypothetical protein